MASHPVLPPLEESKGVGTLRVLFLASGRHLFPATGTRGSPGCHGESEKKIVNRGYLNDSNKNPRTFCVMPLKLTEI